MYVELVFFLRSMFFDAFFLLALLAFVYFPLIGNCSEETCILGSCRLLLEDTLKNFETHDLNVYMKIRKGVNLCGF